MLFDGHHGLAVVAVILAVVLVVDVVRALLRVLFAREKPKISIF